VTRNKKAKSAARAVKASTGMSYTAARRRTMDSEPANVALSREDLLAPYLQEACDGLAAESVDSLGNVELPSSLLLEQADVDMISVDQSSVWVDVIEEYEGGTEVCCVFARADLLVEGLMLKGEAAMSASSGLVSITNPDYNRHYAAVVVEAPVEVQVEFDATITLDTESVEDFNFIGATSL